MKYARTARLIVLSLILGVAAMSMTACSQSPQQKYDHANKQLQQAQKTRDQARKEVNEKQTELAKSQKKLNKAENNLQAAREKLHQASQAVDKTVNDAMLFRTLQAKLVDKDDFGHAAISVTVHDRVATLTGTAPDQKTRQKAVKIAQSQAGVEQVIDHVQIAAPATNQGGDEHDNSAQRNP